MEAGNGMIGQVQTLPPEKPGMDMESLDESLVWLKTFGWSEIREWWDEKFTSSHVGLDLVMVAGSVLLAQREAPEA